MLRGELVLEMVSKKMASSGSNSAGFFCRAFASICSGHKQKKVVLYLCVVTWVAIFFVSGTLFLRRRYESTSLQLEALKNSLQEQIDNLNSKVDEGKSSAMTTFHEKINLSLSKLDGKISSLEREFSERRHRAMQALHALHGGVVHTVQSEIKEQQAEAMPAEAVIPAEAAIPAEALPRKNEIKSVAEGKCIDSMEQPIGSDVQLYDCHGDGGNQAWSLNFNGVIENKFLSMCLRVVEASDGSSVRTASCDENDSQQKWYHANGSFLLDDDQSEGKCLDMDATSMKLLIKLCDREKESQHWTF